MRLVTRDFIYHLSGFLQVREKLDNVAATVLPEDLASQYEPVGLDKTPLQDEALLEKIHNLSSASIEDRLAVMVDIAGVEIKPLLDQFGRELVARLQSLNNEDSQYPKYKSAPIKSQKRSAEKVRNEYDGVALRIVDLVRASIVVNTEEQLATLLHTIFNTSQDEKFAHIQVVRFKNRFKNPTFSGYRDALFNLQVTSKSGHAMIVELQIHLSQVMEHKPESHFYYGFFRKFFLGNMDVVKARMGLLTSLGSYVKNIKLDINPNAASYDENLDLESILSGLEVEGHPDRIDSQRFDEEMLNPDNETLQALIAKLVPFWELQDATDGASPSFKDIDELVRSQNSRKRTKKKKMGKKKKDADRATKNKDGENVSTMDELYEVAEGLKTDLDAFAEKVINNVVVFSDTYMRVCDWSDNPTTERTTHDKSEAIDCFKYDGTSLMSRDYAHSYAFGYNHCGVSGLSGVLSASITVRDEWYLWYLLEFMRLMEKGGHFEILEFRNEFQKEKEDGWYKFFGYRQSQHFIRLTGENGSTVVSLKIHHALLKPFEKDWMYYEEDFFADYLVNKDWNVRIKLLDSLERYVKHIKLDIHPNETPPEEKLDIDSVLSGLEVEGYPDRIDPQRVDQEMNNPDNEALQALIAKLVPFWELQDATDGASPSFKDIDELVDSWEGQDETDGDEIDDSEETQTKPPADMATKNKDGENVSTMDELYEVAEGLKTDLDAFAEKVINNVVVFSDTYMRVCDWSDNPTTERTEQDKSEAIDCFKYDGTSLMSRDYAHSYAFGYNHCGISGLSGILCASITVINEWYLWYLFEFMRLMEKGGHFEIAYFRNEFQKEKEDGWYKFFGYRKCEYFIRVTGEKGSTVVSLQIHHALLKPFEKDWMYYEHDFFARYLVDTHWSARIKLLDSLEVLVKEKMIKNFVGQLEDMIESLIENRDVENLDTFLTLLGPKMLSDMSVAMLCSRAKIRALKLKMEDGDSVPEETLLDARLSLGETILSFYVYCDEVDTLEALEILEAVYEDMKLFHKDEKHPKVLRAAMRYHSAKARVSKEMTDVSDYKAVLDDFIEVFGEDDEATIECMLVYGQILHEKDHNENVEVLQTAYDKAVSVLGESHFVTLNCGLDLALTLETDDANSDVYLEFLEKLYKTFIIVRGRTRKLLDLESKLLDSYKTILDEKSVNLTKTEYNRIEKEIARIGALNKKGLATDKLDFSLDGKWYQYTPWDEVPSDAKSAVNTLGWEVNPNLPVWYPFLNTRLWDDLSPEERKAARVLGFNSYSWHDIFSGLTYITSNLGELSEEQQTACETLGWNEEKWGFPNLLEHEGRMWAELKPEEKQAASEMGFGLRTWNILFATHRMYTKI